MADPFSAKNRPVLLRQLTETAFDVLVIGGGITGAGIALDAAARGLKVALVDMQDFAGGTSGRSTRLIHGGLRYLKQLEFGLVSEVAKERRIIQRNAPHLVTPEPLLLPITKSGTFGVLTTRVAMWVYETLAGVKKEERHRYLSAAEVVRREPLLSKHDLVGGILYYEYRTDDARLTLSVAKEAARRGAVAVNYLKVTAFDYHDGKITGVTCGDQLQKTSLGIRASFVVNASGPWVDELDSMDDPAHGGKLQHTKGVHLVVDRRKLPLTQAVYFDTFDHRMIFALPHRGKTYIGTTDTFFSGDKINPGVTQEDKDYLLKCVNGFFTAAHLISADIESCWAGIRPLIKKPGKKPSEISRRDETFVWKSGLVSIAGGKLTGYRKMAQRVVDIVAAKMKEGAKKRIAPCSTEKIPLAGMPGLTPLQHSAAMASGLGGTELDLLVSCYGAEAGKVLDLMNRIREDGSVSSELPALLHAQLLYAIDHEMCLTPSDFFVRRTGMMYFNISAVIRHNTAVVRVMKDMLKWDEAAESHHKNELLKNIAAAANVRL